MTVTTVAVVGLSSVAFGSISHAESISDLENKQSQLKDDRSTIKANLSDAEAKIADVLIDLDELNTEIDRVKEVLNKNEDKMSETKKDITNTKDKVDALEEEIQKLEDAIEKRYNILKERMVSYQKSGGNISYLEVLFGSQNFSDFISRVSAVNKIADSDSALMKQQEKDKATVEEKQDEVLAKLDELKEMKVELEGMIATIKEQKQENEGKKDKLKSKEKDLMALKEDLEIKDSNLASLEREVRQNLEIARRPAPETVVASETEETTSNNNENITQVKNEKKKNNDKKKSNTASAATVSSSGGGMSAVMNAGKPHMGTPYVWGGKGPGGFDCSGFVSWAFGQGGYSIPSSTSALVGVGSKVSTSNMQPGDIVFFDTYKKNGHVGIYLGGGSFIGAQSSTGVAIANMTSGYWKDTFKGHVRRVQ